MKPYVQHMVRTWYNNNQLPPLCATNKLNDLNKVYFMQIIVMISYIVCKMRSLNDIIACEYGCTP